MSYVTHYQGERLQTYETPQPWFDKLHAKYAFTVDGAASEGNAKLPRYFTEVCSWAGERVFCNPPWSNIPRFVELAATADLAVLLVPARTNARWFHRALALGAQPKFWLGKLRFGETAYNSPVDCLLLLFWSVARADKGLTLPFTKEQP